MNLSSKTGIVMGISSRFSIATGIVKVLTHYGANIVICCQSKKIAEKIDSWLPKELNINPKIIICDVSDDAQIADLSNKIGQNIDFIIHSLAYIDKSALQGRYLDIDFKSMIEGMNISCYSFTKVIAALEGILNKESSLLTLSYYGACKTVANYNAMGVCKAALESSVRYLARDLGGEKKIRVNAISAGAIKTLAASVISGFNNMIEHSNNNSFLKRSVSAQEIGNACAFLISDLSKAITAQTIYVDCGLSSMHL